MSAAGPRTLRTVAPEVAAKPFFSPGAKKYRDIFQFMNDYSDVFFYSSYTLGASEEETLCFNMYDQTARLLSVFAIADLRHDFDKLLDTEYKKKSNVSTLLLAHICNGFYELGSTNNTSLLKYLVGEYKTIRNHASAVSTFEEVLLDYFKNSTVTTCLSNFFQEKAYAKHYTDRNVRKYTKEDMNLTVWTHTYDNGTKPFASKPVALLVDAQNGKPATRLFVPEEILKDKTKDEDTYVVGTPEHMYIYNRTSINDAASKGASDAHNRFNLCLDAGGNVVVFSETDMMCGSELSLSKPTPKSATNYEIMNTQVIQQDDLTLMTYGFTFNNKEKPSVNEMAGVKIRGKKTGEEDEFDVTQVTDDPLQYTAKLICKSSGDRCQIHSLRSPFPHTPSPVRETIKAGLDRISTLKNSPLSSIDFNNYSIYFLTNDYLAAAEAYLAQINTIYSSLNAVTFQICYDESDVTYDKVTVENCHKAFQEYVSYLNNGGDIVLKKDPSDAPTSHAMKYVSSLWEISRAKYLGRVLEFHPAHDMNSETSLKDRKISTILRLYGESGANKDVFFQNLNTHFEIQKWGGSVEKETELMFEAAGILTGTIRTRAQLYMGLHNQLSQFLQSNKIFFDANALAHHILIAAHPDISAMFKTPGNVYVKELIRKIASLDSKSLLHSQLIDNVDASVIKEMKTVLDHVIKNIEKMLDSNITAIDPINYSTFFDKFVRTKNALFLKSIRSKVEYDASILLGGIEISDADETEVGMNAIQIQVKAAFDENIGLFSAIFREIGVLVFYKMILNKGEAGIFNSLNIYSYLNVLDSLFGSGITDKTIEISSKRIEFNFENTTFDTLMDTFDHIAVPKLKNTEEADALKAELGKSKARTRVKTFLKETAKDVKAGLKTIISTTGATAKKLMVKIGTKNATTDVPLQVQTSKQTNEELNKVVQEKKTKANQGVKTLLRRIGFTRQRGGLLKQTQRVNNVMLRKMLTRRARVTQEDLVHLQNSLVEFLFALNAKILSTMDMNTICYMSRSIFLNSMIYVLDLDSDSSIEEKLQRTLVLTTLLLSSSRPEWEKEWNRTWMPFLSRPHSNPEIVRLLPGCIYDDILFHDMPYTLAWDTLAFSGYFPLEERLEMRDSCYRLMTTLKTFRLWKTNTMPAGITVGNSTRNVNRRKMSIKNRVYANTVRRKGFMKSTGSRNRLQYKHTETSNSLGLF